MMTEALLYKGLKVKCIRTFYYVNVGEVVTVQYDGRGYYFQKRSDLRPYYFSGDDDTGLYEWGECFEIYGHRQLNAKDDQMDEILEEFAQAMEGDKEKPVGEVLFPDFDELADLSTKRLTKQEEYDIMCVLSKLTWEDFK